MKTIVVVERRIQTNWGVWIRLKDSDPNDPFAVPEARRPWRDATGRKRYRLKTRLRDSDVEAVPIGVP